MVTLAEKHLTGHSPEVPMEIVRRDLTILAGGQVGFQISRFGVAGLDMLLKNVGKSANIPALEKNSRLIARGVGALASVLGLIFLGGRTSRLLAFGAVWENITSGVDFVIEQARKTAGV